jgi:hypothetical protein
MISSPQRAAIQLTMQSDSDNPAGPPSLASEELPPPAASSPLACDIPPGIAASQAAFRRDLSELLKKWPGQWVAYHADERIGFARSPFELYEKCFRLGFKEEEFVVRRITEEIAPDVDCTPLWDA